MTEMSLISFRSGVDVNNVDDNGFTALHWACANGQLGTVEFLIKNGGDVTVAGNQGETPLLLAACYGFIEIVKYLLSIGVDVNYADEVSQVRMMVSETEKYCTYWVAAGLDVFKWCFAK